MNRPLNDAEQQLLAHLERIRNYKQMIAATPKGYHYHGPEDFVLQHGQWFDVTPFPSEMPEGVPRSCYGNSALLGVDRRLRYFEGYAVRVIPVSHAWNADQEDRLIDTTWQNTGAAYFGVEFAAKDAYRAINKHTCMLEDWVGQFQIFKKPWPGVQKGKRKTK